MNPPESEQNPKDEGTSKIVDNPPKEEPVADHELAEREAASNSDVVRDSTRSSIELGTINEDADNANLRQTMLAAYDAVLAEFDAQDAAPTALDNVALQSAVLAGSIGAVAWSVHRFWLMEAAFALLPAWSMIDPLILLRSQKKKRQTGESGESLHSIARRLH